MKSSTGISAIPVFCVAIVLCLVQYVKVIVICARGSAALCTTLRHSRDCDQECAHVGETGAPHPDHASPRFPSDLRVLQR
jgi:hypothetical protein